MMTQHSLYAFVSLRDDRAGSITETSMHVFRTLPLALSALLFSNAVSSEMTNVTERGFVSTHVLVIAASRHRVFRALTNEVGRWWDPEHSYSGESRNFSIDTGRGGCFCERLGAGYVRHMTVVFIELDKTLRMVGALGPLQQFAVDGSMTFALSDADDGKTRLTYRYVVGGFVPDGIDTFAQPVDAVQLGQLQRLQRFVETGNPAAP